MDCWQQISQFQQFLQCMLSQMGPVPLQGVTDGSDAKAGYIGEYMKASVNVNYAASVVTTTTASVIVIPPGDWNLWAYGQISAPVGSVFYEASPMPAGLSNALGSYIGSGDPAAATYASPNTPVARGSFTVPTLIAFSVRVDQLTGSLPAGYMILSVEARRMR
jgi:hypothetical protein